MATAMHMRMYVLKGLSSGLLVRLWASFTYQDSQSLIPCTDLDLKKDFTRHFKLSA